MSENAATIENLENAVSFLRDKFVVKPGKNGVTTCNLSKKDTIAFFSAAGVPPRALEQVNKAEDLLLQGSYAIVGDTLVDGIEGLKKEGKDVFAPENTLKVRAKVTTLSGSTLLQASSTISRTNNMTKEVVRKFGSTKYVVNVTKSLPKTTRQALADRCRAACEA